MKSVHISGSSLVGDVKFFMIAYLILTLQHKGFWVGRFPGVVSSLATRLKYAVSFRSDSLGKSPFAERQQVSYSQARFGRFLCR